MRKAVKTNLMLRRKWGSVETVVLLASTCALVFHKKEVMVPAGRLRMLPSGKTGRWVPAEQ